MAHELQGVKIAILATDGFEYVELTEPRKALEDAGAKTVVVSIQAGSIQGWNHDKPGESVHVNQTLGTVLPREFDALLLPGGVQNPDTLRTNRDAVKFVKEFFLSNKPVGAICHGPWMLVEADVLQDRKVTSWPSLKTDIINAGGEWADKQVVVDNGLVTSRKPADIPAFNEQLIQEFSARKRSQIA